MFSCSIFKNVFTGLLLISFAANAESPTSNGKGIYEKLADGYREQAANFSDETLVNKSNSPNWSWLWITPYHVHGELVKRASKSQIHAAKLTSLLLNSFEESRDMNGTHVQSSLLQVFSSATQNPEQLPLSFTKTMAEKLEKLSRLLRDEEDQKALTSAQEIFTSRLIGQVGVALSATKQFEQTYQFYQFLKYIGQDYGKFSWIRNTSEYETAKTAVLNRLFETAETNDFEKLVKIYSSKEQGLKIPAALMSMHKLNAQATIEIVRLRVEEFDEKSGDFSSIVDEINFLKLHASKDILAALMPKLLRLLEIAEKRKDAGTQALILDSFSGGSGGGSNGSGGGGSVRPTWGQVFSGSNYESKCTSGANTALALYRRGLINGTEITFALKDLASSDCDRRGNRGILYGVVASICEEASRKNDTGVLNSCFTDVFVPLLQWKMKNQNSEHAQAAKEYLERLFKILPSQTVASLNPSCRIRISVAPKYGKNEQLIEEGKTLYIQKSNGVVTVNECQKMPSAPTYVIEELSQWVNIYSRQYRDNGNMTKTYSWDTERTISACIRDLIDTAYFKNVTSFLDRKITQLSDKATKSEYPYYDLPGTTKNAVTIESESDYSESYGTRIDTETTIIVPGGTPVSDWCVKNYYYGSK